MVELAPDFDEFFGCLTVHGVEFVIVGAYALAFHGVPRVHGRHRRLHPAHPPRTVSARLARLQTAAVLLAS